jgi:hypothetical protein
MNTPIEGPARPWHRKGPAVGDHTSFADLGIAQREPELREAILAELHALMRASWRHEHVRRRDDPASRVAVEIGTTLCVIDVAGSRSMGRYGTSHHHRRPEAIDMSAPAALQRHGIRAIKGRSPAAAKHIRSRGTISIRKKQRPCRQSRSE